MRIKNLGSIFVFAAFLLPKNSAVPGSVGRRGYKVAPHWTRKLSQHLERWLCTSGEYSLSFREWLHGCLYDCLFEGEVSSFSVTAFW